MVALRNDLMMGGKTGIRGWGQIAGDEAALIKLPWIKLHQKGELPGA